MLKYFTMIGVFDSGIGGLSVLKVLKEKSPQTDVVYFGDIKNAPYGIKTQEELKKLTTDGIKILLNNGAKNILSACNSISAVMVVDEIKEEISGNFEIVEMIKPTVRYHKNLKNIMIFATPATIKSTAYQRSFLQENIEIEAFAISELAGAIEFGKTENEIGKIIEETVISTEKNKVENVILCCTHYPFVSHLFKKEFEKRNKKVNIFNPAEPVVDEALKNFGNLNGSGKLKFLISQDSQNFRNKVAELFSDFEYEIEII